MADGLCTDDPSGDVIDQTVLNVYDNAVLCETMDGLKDDVCDKVSESESCAIFGNDNVCTKHQGIIEEDCRKKRCVDRYDSSESSDSGVAVLSCTDCSGSSTASSDITDPGSPFSTASSHSEDSGSQPAKMPPTQTAHHPWPPWTADEGPTCKRPAPATAAYPESIEDVKRKTCLTFTAKIVPQDKLISSRNSRKGMQQGKITEYFKSQVKCNGIKRDILNMVKKPLIGKMLVDQQTQFNSLKTQNIRKDQKRAAAKKIVQSKIKKIAPVSVPRKILPAPSNITDKLTISDQLSNLAKFTPTVTLTALSFPPNYTYIHAKGPKPQESPIYVPQIPIPIINRTPCLNVIQPVQKLTAINNFNCVKLNATVVPIVKMPHKITSPPPATPLSVPVTLPPSPAMIPGVTFSVDTAIPTVLSAKPRVPSPAIPLLMKQSAVPSGTGTATGTKTLLENVRDKYRAEDNSRTEEPHRTEECTREEKSPTPTTDSDSGISNKECLEIIEVCVSEQVTVEEQKSPILSKPKTIRFPAKQVDKEEGKSTQHSTDGQCRWTECNSCFDTSGALLEHLQVKHVISQTTQEHYVCLWIGCKVHGRTSCSRSWLERHVLAHAGTKPFRCIVDGCGQRFTTQLMLERHVNSHFNSDGSPNNNLKKSPENGVCKLYKRNGKKIRFRRQPWSARMFDFLDSGIMEGLQYKLLFSTQKRTLGKINEPGDSVHLQSEVLARRIETDGSVKYLLKWHPADIVPDEWVLEKEYKPTKVVSIPRLNPSSKTALGPSLFPSSMSQQETTAAPLPRQKHSRKPIFKRT